MPSSKMGPKKKIMLDMHLPSCRQVTSGSEKAPKHMHV